jgi:oxygen-independent coproporphyrinogen-3 oxidase
MSFGPSAASDFAGTRYTFASDLSRYIKAVRTGDAITTECEYLPIKERAGEYIMLRMRTVYGIERTEYETTFLMPFDPLEQVLAVYQSRGLTRQTQGRWCLTPQGFLVSNQLIGRLIEAQRKSTPLSPHRF